MSATATLDQTAALPSARPARRLRLRRRHLWLVPGLAIAIAANKLGEANGVGILALVAFGIMPDVPRLLRSRGRRLHDLLHQPLIATVALSLSLAVAPSGVVPAVVLVATLVWFSHVVIGRGVGDMPRPTRKLAHA